MICTLISLKSFACQKYSNRFILVHIIGTNQNSKGMWNAYSLFLHYTKICYFVEECNKRNLTSPGGGGGGGGGITIINGTAGLLY